jgi:membrane-associated phospholipid phosphatase
MFRLRFLYIIIALLVQSPSAITQVSDTIKRRGFARRIIAPASLIGGGILVNNSQFEQNLQHRIQVAVGENFHSDVDDYLQYVPIIQLYISDLAGVESRNHWFDQTKYLLISNLITSSITHGIKKLTPKLRPNGAPDAFPSGHTSFAFNNAAVLYQEFNHTAPVLAYSGFLFSTTTAVYRMMNNRHWLSDVLFGAGLGILSVELVYWIEPFKSFNPFIKSDAISCQPIMSDNYYGIYFSYKF